LVWRDDEKIQWEKEIYKEEEENIHVVDEIALLCMIKQHKIVLLFHLSILSKKTFDEHPKS